MSSTDNTQPIQPVEVDGHMILVGANRLNGPNPLPSYYFVITLQFQDRPGVVGYGTRTGLVIPREGAQTGEWTEALLAHLYKSLPTWWEGRDTPAGFPVSMHVTKNETYHEGPDAVDLSDFEGDDDTTINL